MKIITFDSKKCVGCLNCELACAYENSLTTCEREESMIRVNHYIDEHAIIPMTCLHCEEAWCMNICPAGAISRVDSTGAVVINQDKCVGCKMCILACPYGSIHFDDRKLVSAKCNLCGGEPRCVEHCIAAALNYEEPEEYAERMRKRADRKMIENIKHTGK